MAPSAPSYNSWSTTSTPFMNGQKIPLGVSENESHCLKVIESWNTAEENTTRAMPITISVMVMPTAEVILVTCATITLRRNAMQAFWMR